MSNDSTAYVKLPSTVVVTTNAEPSVIQVSKILGAQGKSAYHTALKNGFEGTESEWLESLHGPSAYAVALDNGYVGTEEEWLETLKIPKDFTQADAGKFLTNDGDDVMWETIDMEEHLNSQIIVWDLGEI